MSSIATSEGKTLDSNLEVVRTLFSSLAGFLGTVELLLPRSLLLAESGSLVFELGLPVCDSRIAILASLDQDAVLLLQALEFETE